jgi:hypothetical protein
VTATPLAELLAAVPSLNDPSQPFTYAVVGQRIVGTWDVVKATSLYPTEVSHIDKDYKLEVDLDEDEHSYDYEDEESETHAGVDGDGLHFEKELFKGKEKKKEFHFELGGVSATSKGGTDEGVSKNPVVYSFDTDRIKEPLFAFLEQHGWERKKGFFRRLFS